MHPVFWSNTIWYIMLSITSIISIVLVLLKSKNRTFTIAFTIATLGFAYYIESILVISFKAYKYHPKIVEDQFQDGVLGNFFSQISISSTSALIIVFNLSYKWYFIFAAIYYLIEEFFIKLGIYQHFWYKSLYTALGLIPFFWFVKKWYNKLISSPKNFIYYITLFLGVAAAFGNSIITSLKLLQIQIFKADFYSESSKNHTTVSIIYTFFLINVLINLYRWRLNWVWKGMVFLCLFAVHYFLYRAGILYIKNGWFLIIPLLDLFGCYFWIIVMNYLLKRKRDIALFE